MRFFRDENRKYLLGIVELSAAVVLLGISDVVFPRREAAVLCFLVKGCGFLLLTYGLRGLYRPPRK